MPMKQFTFLEKVNADFSWFLKLVRWIERSSNAKELKANLRNTGQKLEDFFLAQTQKYISRKNAKKQLSVLS
jgi:hypothetical protein